MGCCSERFTMQSASRNNSTLSLAGLRHEKLLRLNVSTSSPETWKTLEYWGCEDLGAVDCASPEI